MKRALTHVPFLSDLSAAPTPSHCWKLKWSQETRRSGRLLKWTQEGWTNTNVGHRSKGSFLDSRCLCRPILLASCPSWDSLLLLLHWILGLWDYLASNSKVSGPRVELQLFRQPWTSSTKISFRKVIHDFIKLDQLIPNNNNTSQEYTCFVLNTFVVSWFRSRSATIHLTHVGST